MSLGDVGMQEDIQREMEKRAALAVTLENTFPYIKIADREYGLTKSWVYKLIPDSRPISENVFRALIPNVAFAKSVSDVRWDESKLHDPQIRGKKHEALNEVINIDPRLVENFYINAQLDRKSQYSLIFEIEGAGGEIYLDRSKHGSKVVSYWLDGESLTETTEQRTTLNELIQTYDVRSLKINPRNSVVHGFIVTPYLHPIGI